MVPNSRKGDGKPRAKCKICGTMYLATSFFRWFLILPSCFFSFGVDKFKSKKHCLSTSEWDKEEKIDIFLSTFYDVNCDFYGNKHLTTNFRLS